MDGDKIIALLAMTMKEKGRLDGDTAVVTVMSNLGFIKYMESQGINTEKTAVGDRYVLENMRENGFAIGGEQSGHVILLHHATTGDGQLTAIQLLCLMKRSGRPLSELAQVMRRMPQVMVNVTVSKEGKLQFYNNDAIKTACAGAKDRLGSRGRVLVRVSGTEPLVRVMVEGEDEAEISAIAGELAQLVEKELA